MPKGSPGVKRRPKTQEEKDHQREMILKRWHDPLYRERVSTGLKNGWNDEERRKNHKREMKELAQTSEWRKNVSEGTKKAFEDPKNYLNLLIGQEESRARHGVPYFGGDTGDAFALVLCPAGFIREYRIYYGDPVVAVFGGRGFRKKNLSLDFAHVEGKVNIELDGPGHKVFLGGDELRDRMLKDLGWRIIRIRHD